MMYVDVMSRLPGQSLMILDRATMAYSLESRSPFLDPRFAEFMARVPVGLKIRGRRLRYLERRLGERYLPPRGAATEEAGVRLAAHVHHGRGGAHAGAARCCSRASWCATATSRRAAVRRLVDEHLARRRDHGNRIWLLLSAEVWYRRYIGGRSTADLEAELDDARSRAAARSPGARG